MKVSDSSSCGWSFLSWCLDIWYKGKSNTCYLVSPFFVFYLFSQVATNVRFTSKTSVILLLPISFPLSTRKILLLKIMEHKLQEAILEGIRRDVQLGNFILLSLPIFQQLPRLTSLYFFLILSNDRWNLTAIFVDNSQMLLNNEPHWKSGNYSLPSNKIQSTLLTLFTLVIYPLTFLASNDCPHSATLTCRNTFCTTFKLCGSSRLG